MTKHISTKQNVVWIHLVVFRQYRIVYKYLIGYLDNPMEIVCYINQISLDSTHWDLCLWNPVKKHTLLCTKNTFAAIIRPH